MTAENQLRALTAPVESEYLNETLFLTADDALDEAQESTIAEALSGAALFTDGLQMLCLKMPERIPHKPFFNPLFRFLEKENDSRIRQEQLEKFLQSPRIADRADDDLTLLLALLT